MAFFAAILALVIWWNHASPHAQSANRTGMSGQQLYQAACVACHGADGKGQPIAVRGFTLETPDFTDCRLATSEADLDWESIIKMGGAVRAFDQMMPAFGDELSEDEIGKILQYLRTFCSESGWPHGDLNMPRPLVTEKAYPENEAVLTTTVVPSHERSVSNQFLYEHRVGRRGQYELFMPFDLRRGSNNSTWNIGIGDVGAAYKHVLLASWARGSIVSAGGEIKFPTGSESKGLGAGVTVLEAFGAYSQALPTDGFLHAHVGFEAPSDPSRASREAFWRLAIGKSYMKNRWGRAWSPMLEMLGARKLAGDRRAPVEWDALPQMQVSLSTRQHIRLNAGVRIPMSQRQSRRTSAMMYLLWDWFDGSLVSGW
jgi:mono/diheme cytochrome c family protein